jgi:hypothetical protein
MKRWIAAFLGLMLTMGMTAGCRQKCFISEQDFYIRHDLPAGLEDGDQALVQPTHETTPAPPTVDHPDRPARHLSLQEAIAIALENGTTGNRNGGANTQGLVDDSSLQNNGGTLNGLTDRVRVLALQPAISAANIEAALARFDALSVTSFTTTNTDEPLSGAAPNQFSLTNGTNALFNTSIVKALPSGGVVNTSFQTQYTLLSQPGIGVNQIALGINPNYTARLTFGFEQPLLRNFGTDINQILNRVAPISGSTLPTAAATGFNTQQSNLTAVNGQGLEGILITRLRFDQQRAEFERQMHNLLLNVEVAYWNLYSAYGQLYSNEEVLRVLHKLWMDTYVRAEAGDQRAPPDVLAITRAQFEEFRGERTNSLAAVLEAERNLRGFMGLPPEDGTRLVPVTPPTLAPFQPDWGIALNDAMVHRPELVLARENLQFHELALTREKNNLKPDLRFVAQYQPVGVGNTLSGNGNLLQSPGAPANAFQALSSDHFNDMTVGLTLSVPLGYRFEHASVRSARLQLAQAYYVLKNEEEKVTRNLTQQFQGLSKWYRLIEDRRAERKGYADALKTKFTLVELSKKTVDLDILDNQRRLALALTKEYQAIAEYNNSLARVEFARGTIMQRDNVVIAENGLTPCAEVRAVEHERERTRALVLRDRADPLYQPGRIAGSNPTPDRLESSTMDETPATSGKPAASERWTAPPPKIEDGPAPFRPLPDAPAFKSDGGKPAIAPLPEKESLPEPKTVPQPPAPAVSVSPPPTLPDLSSAKETPDAPVAPATAPTTPAAAPKTPAPTAPATTPPPPAPEAGSLELPPPPPIPDVINDGNAPPK